ncbi:MAG: hypothetical protein ISS93_02215 [Candidatus Aenigmarchaeota archaeon]|nr:hypothetical protein [Candidatus Aenigmarchaeota archaeon]
MLKGEVQATDAAGVLLFTFAVLSIMLLVSSFFLKVTVEVNDARGALDLVDTTQLVGSCLENNGVIDSSFLDNNNGKEFSAIPLSGQCKRDVQVRIEDLEGNGKWSFGSIKEGAHYIHASLSVGEEIHVGRLYVSV